VLMDVVGSVAVVVGAALVILTGSPRFDPLVSLAIGFLILPRAVALLRESAHILLEGAPSDVDVARVRSDLLAVAGVDEVHDLHVWTLTSGMHSASVHICAQLDSPRDEVLRAVHRVLREDAGVGHSTVQIEWGSSARCETIEHHFEST
jgi:cobalt-zinc-cadmium efflux system protein